MLKSFLRAWVTAMVALPSLCALLYGMHQAGEATGLSKQSPDAAERLRWAVNTLITLLVEYWLWWIMLAAMLAGLWVLLGEVPVEKSRKQFQTERQRRLKKRG